MDESILVFERVADSGLRPRARCPLSLVLEAGAIVSAEIRERTVEELAAGIDVGLRIGLHVVVLVTAEGVLPRSGSAYGKLSAGQEIVLVRDLVSVGRQHRVSIEPPIRLHACPVIRVPQPQAKRHTRRETYPDVPALQSVRVNVIDSLSLGVELVHEEVIVVNLVGARDR